ncbi:hypothetical protein CBI35_17955 [Pantoea sp. AV62]|nr:hypothetical protein HA39_08985 [Pantoea brenneri]OXM20471.1 hypothetical protein CBI35_17955 [Pantoea sp. AV62]
MGIKRSVLMAEKPVRQDLKLTQRLIRGRTEQGNKRSWHNVKVIPDKRFMLPEDRATISP